MQSTRERALATVLRDLLDSPDLNLGNLEDETVQAIQAAEHELELHAAGQAVEPQPAPVAAGEHTPGPWQATGWENCTVNSAAGFTIVAFPGGDGGESGRLSISEAKANARLIAAAPDILAALQWLTEAVADEDRGSTESAIMKARIALARATGKEG
jgi:hypothetical protein